MTVRNPAIEQLRRRVYSPAATQQDLAEYRRLVEETERATPSEGTSPGVLPPDADESPAGRAAAGPRRSARTGRVGAAIGAVLLAAGVAALVSQPPRTRPGAEPVPAPTPLEVAAGSRAALLQPTRGAGAGIAAYLDRHDVPAVLRSTPRGRTIEASGTGPRTVPVRPPGITTETRRATVLLLVQASGRAGWTVSTLRPYLRASDPLNLLDRRTAQLDAGAAAFATFSYGPMTRPASLRVEVPKSVRWRAAVVFAE